MFERQRTEDRELAEIEAVAAEEQIERRAPGKRARAALYEAALGVPGRPRGVASTGGPGKAGRATLARTWLPAPGTIAPREAWMQIVAHAARPAGLRAAASAADATVQSEINAGGAARDAAEAAIAAAQDAGQPLPADVAERMARALGHTFAHVRVHTGPAAAAAARALGARAFTLGSHIYFAEGELAPGTAAGDRLLRHELTHVVQFDQGRLAARGGGLEVAEHHSAAEVEARAAEDRGEPAPRPAELAAPAPHAPRHEVANANQPTATASSPAGARPGAAAVAAPLSLGGAMMDVVRLVSPRLATLIEHGLDGQISDIVRDAIHAGVTALVPRNPLAGLTAVGASIADIASTLIGAAQGDQKCCETFQRWCEKLGQLARKGAASKLVQDFKKGFDEVDSFVASIVRLFGGALVDGFRQQLNDLRALGGFLSQAVNAVASRLRAAADYVLRQLRLPSVADIEATLTRLAEAAFALLKRGIDPAIAALKAVAKTLYELSGLKGLVELFEFAGELIEVTKWLIAHRSDEDIVKHAREQMAHTFLPRLLTAMGGLVGKIQAAIAWCERHLTATIAIAVAAGALMLGPLAPLALAIAGIVIGLRALWAAIGPTLTKLWEDTKALAIKIFAYAKPVIDTLVQVTTLIANPVMAPVILASSAWLLLPECFKEPLINLFLDLLIAFLEASPNAVMLFGPLWRFVRAGAIAFFQTIRSTWSKADKVTAVNRLAHIGSGRNAEALAGFVVGFFKGVVYGVLDPFKMVYELLKMGFDLASFFGKLAARFPQVAAVIQRYLPQLEARAHEILAAGRQALDDFLAGKIGFEDLWALLQRFLGAVEAKAGELGARAAGKLRGWILGGVTDYDIGETIGIAVGFIVVFLLITYFSAGIVAEADGALAVIRTIAKVLNAPYELLGAALKPLGALFKPVLGALGTIGTRLGLKVAWDGAMKAFEKLATVLGKLVEELIVAIEGKIAGRVATLLEELTARLGAELAEKLIAELGERGAQELVDKLGAELVKKLGQVMGPKLMGELADKLGAELLEQLVDRGLTGAQIEHLANVFEKDGLELLLAEGLTGPELVRLGTIDEQALRRLLLTLDAREVLALEQGLGKAGLERLSERLSGTQVKALADTLGAPTVKALLDAGQDVLLRRLGTLPDATLAKFAGLEVAELTKFGALTEEGFARFAALDAPMIKAFASLDAATLRSFAFLDDAALRKFGRLPVEDLAKLTGIDTIALRDFAAMSDQGLADLLATHPVEDIRVFGNMTPEAWAQSHADARALDRATTGGTAVTDTGHTFAKHGTHTTVAQQEARLRTGVAPDGSVMRIPPDSCGRFASDAAQVEAGKVAERHLYDNMISTRGRLKGEVSGTFDVPGAGFSYSLVPPGTGPPPFLGGQVVETMCNKVHAAWRLDRATNEYILITMYPVP